MKRIIINADDFGYCSQRNRGILELLERKNDHGFPLLTSVSVMVNAAASEECCLLKKFKDISKGLHFNITEGKPLINLENSGILNENGYFLGKVNLYEAALENQINLTLVREELEAQLRSFKQLTGELPSHVDGHQHVHIFPGVREVFAITLKKFGIEWTRIPEDDNIENCLWLEESRRKFFSLVHKESIEAKILFSELGLKFGKPFIGLKTMGSNMTIQRLKDEFQSLNSFENITSEFMVHPGYRAIQGKGGCGEGPDEFALSSDREHEMKILMDYNFISFLKSNDFVPTSSAVMK